MLTVDSSNRTVTLEKGYILDAKRKSSLLQKSTRANPQKKTTSGNLTGGNPTLIQTTTNSSTESIVIPDSPQKYSQDSSFPGHSIFGSALEPKVLDSTPEETHPLATQLRSTVVPPAFFCWSPSHFFNPKVKSGYVQTSRKSPNGKLFIIVAE